MSIAIITEDKHFSYAEIDALGERLYQSIPTDKQLIFIFCRNNVASVYAYLAGLKYQHCVALLDAKLSTTLKTKLIEHYQPNFIWEPQENHQLYHYIEGEYGLRAHAADPIDIHPDVALLLSTSGSTGSPKFVRLSQRNLDSNARAIAEYLQLNAKEKPMMTLPIQYSYGLSVLNSHFYVKAPVVLTQLTLFEQSFWQMASDQNITSLSGVPYTFVVLKRIGLFDKNLPKLKTLTHAGGRLNPALFQYFFEQCQRHHIRFYTMYGQTEASPRMSFLPPGENRPNCIGQAIPGGKLWINSNTHELMYQGPNVMLGYCECRNDLKKGDEMQGVLPTGDIATQDSSGFFYIKGRRSRFGKLNGLRISLDEVEASLNAQGISAAVTQADEKLIITTLSSQEFSSIKNLLQQQFNIHHLALDLKVCDAFPRLSTGKIDYQRLESNDVAH